MMLSIFIGYDQRQPIAYNVAQQSILNHASKPVRITPLVLKTLPIKRRGLTDFTYSRWLCPWLCSYHGMSVFMDGDVLLRDDIYKMLDYYCNDALTLVKHGPQRRFEWPSVMLFDNAKCQVLTPDFVQNDADIMKLKWAPSIGELPHLWNHLVGYDQPNPEAKLVHFTQGIPCFQETYKDEHGDEWRKTAQQLVSSVTWGEIMGQSVHVESVKARNG